MKKKNIKKPKLLEKEIQKQIKTYLEYNKWKCYRINNGGTYNAKAKAFVFHGTAGVSDLLAIKEGYPILFLECKRKGGVISDAQKKFVEAIKGSQNGWAEIVYSLEEVEVFIKELNKHYK